MFCVGSEIVARMALFPGKAAIAILGTSTFFPMKLLRYRQPAHHFSCDAAVKIISARSKAAELCR